MSSAWMLLLRRRQRHLPPLVARSLSSFKDDGGGAPSKVRLAQCYRRLELEPGSSKDLVRRQYVKLARRFHPDSAAEGDAAKFTEIDEAYNVLMAEFRREKRREEDCVGEFGLYYEERRGRGDGDEDEDGEYVHPDIRHTAPQHRQYLDNEGFGYGTPGQRQRQYTKYRAMRAAENVFEHRAEKLSARYETRLAHQDKKRSRQHKAKGAIERVVEDLISESMARGEFDNLKGKGKPLEDRTRYNPFSDFTSHKMNEILTEGGFAPEWIMLQKEIREEIDRIRGRLRHLRDQFPSLTAPPEALRSDLFPPSEPTSKRLSVRDQQRWADLLKVLDKDAEKLNKNIDRFNLVVPMMSGQMFHFKLAQEAEKVLREEPRKVDIKSDFTSSREDRNVNVSNAVISRDDASNMGLLTWLETLLHAVVKRINKGDKS